MKKFVCLLLCALMAVACAFCISCGDGGKTGNGPQNAPDDGWTDNY